MTVTTASVLASICSFSNSDIRLAWIAAPLADSSLGLIAELNVDGAIMIVLSGKCDCKLDAILGV